jgi:hypothetical protein
VWGEAQGCGVSSVHTHMDGAHTHTYSSIHIHHKQAHTRSSGSTQLRSSSPNCAHWQDIKSLGYMNIVWPPPAEHMNIVRLYAIRLRVSAVADSAVLTVCLPTFSLVLC